jgi:protease-4
VAFVNILTRLKSFLGFLWKAIGTLRVVVANLVFLLVLLVVLSAMFSDQEPLLPHDSVLLLNPSGTLVEELSTPEPAQAFLRKLGRDASPVEETRAQDVIDAVREAATDSRIKALVIDPRDLQGCDTTKLMDIGQAIRDFKETGKPVLAHAMFYTQGQYLLASYADTVSVNPLGGVLITGFGMYPIYFKGLLDKAQINFHVFRVGDYKTAVEPFLRETMSEEAKQSGRQWLDGLWQAWLNEAARNRNIQVRDIRSYVDSIDTRLGEVKGDAARLATSTKLVDSVITSEQFDQILAGKIGKKTEDVHRIAFQDYLRMGGAGEDGGKEVVGVIRGRGPILPGKQPENMIGSESVAELFEGARKDASIVAVVLRLDSPGGSAAASEEILREISRTQEAGKPVVVSMGSLAASGAYWIASGANRIVASPTTLTGSIGIFAAFPTFENTGRMAGLTTDGIGTTALSDLGHPLRPLAPQAEAAMGHLLQYGYDQFIARVAVGRRMTPATVEASAQGQVFLGQEAHKRKLVDQLGNLDDAVKIAGTLAGLTVVNRRELRRELSAHEKMMQALFSTGQTLFTPKSPTITRLLAVVLAQTSILDTFVDPNHIYARSLECEAAMF